MNRSQVRCSAAIAVAVAAWLGGSQAQGAEQVYRSASASGLPVYTNEAVGTTSSLVMIFEAPLVRKVSVLERAIETERPSRSRIWRGNEPSRKHIEALLHAAARTHGIDEMLLRAVVHVESGFNPLARSHAGAAGLMQLMPATAQRYGVRDRHDVAQNIEGGTRYLKDLLKMFKGDISLALAAYNAGEGAVQKYGNRIPPYSETRAYVPAVLARYREYLQYLKAAGPRGEGR